jgi:hypothetical protein
LLLPPEPAPHAGTAERAAEEDVRGAPPDALRVAGLDRFDRVDRAGDLEQRAGSVMAGRSFQRGPATVKRRAELSSLTLRGTPPQTLVSSSPRRRATFDNDVRRLAYACPVPIRATVLLCDSAQAVEGKLYILGGGWNLTGPEPSPSAIAVYMEVSWDLTNVQHHWRLELLDADDQPVMVPTPIGEQALVLEGNFEVGRPPGIMPGIGLGLPLAVNLGPLPLTPGRRYVWRFSVNGDSEDNWRLPFSTRPVPQLQARDTEHEE